ncbi:uncharacterized protein PSFLO_04673 [Pseudozyma flocculosa]|uniref:Kinetochore protein mis13 n=1 Tax=Pseudozyma flocculosa TaxID=84751 RepID=A0A5C3F3W3_9BASI|nr:uncharacterized protein PSFLO_04673 [Pseudozyma flocculosa]
MTTAAATRRSSRLSGASASSNDDSAAMNLPATSSAAKAPRPTRRSTAAASARSSGASSGASSAVIPAVALGGIVATESASRKAKGKAKTDPAGAEELLLAEEPPTKSKAASRKNGAASASQPTARPARAPRKTLGEEAEGEFIFQRDVGPQRKAASTQASNGAHAAAAAAMPPPAMGAPAARKRRAASPSSGKQPSSSSSSSSRAGSSRSVVGRTTYEPLPDEAAGETPIIRRNQAFRAGLEVHPGSGGSGTSGGRRSGGSGRRSSLGLKGEKRRSSLRDPAVAAYPHDDVPDHELFRHCPPDTTPQIRMRHLMGWSLKRSLGAALGELGASKTTAPSAATKGKRKKADAALPALTEAEKRELSQHREGILRVLEQLLSDLHCGAFGINWIGENDPAPGGPALQPHPRNASNIEAKSRLASTVQNMSSERKQWEKEQWQIEAYEADTAELERQLAATSDDEKDLASVDDLPEVEWDEDEDLSDFGRQQLHDARRAIAALDGLLSGNPVGPPDATAKPPASKGKARARSSKAAADAKEAAAAAALTAAEDTQGSEQDSRWKDVEFNVDLLRARSHQFAQLQLLASRYVRTVSAQNAQALRDRTSASSSYANAAAGTKRSGSMSRGASAEADSDEASAGGGAGRLDRLLGGIRESRSDIGSGAEPAPAVKRQRTSSKDGSQEPPSTDRFEPDESDAMDLLRALAKS